MGGDEDVDDGLQTPGQNSADVILQHSLEGLLLLPLGMLAGQRLDAIQGKGQLEVKWLFRPECAVVVKDGDAVHGRHELGAALGGHRIDKAVDRLFAWSLIPRGKRIGLSFACFQFVHLGFRQFVEIVRIANR